MLIRSRAPLRIGLAGGGTDLSPYCDEFGGAILNATINLYAHASLSTDDVETIEFGAADMEEHVSVPLDRWSDVEEPLILHRAVYRRVVDEFCDGKPFPCVLNTYCDAPPGSGLGSSSTLVVAMLKAYVELLGLPLGEYDIGRLAFEIERVECGMYGGRQDQYAATFGGVNFMEFYADNRVVVNPLRIKNWILSELESSSFLYYTNHSRRSEDVVEKQRENIEKRSGKTLEAMHELKESAYRMKEHMLLGELEQFGDVLNRSWQSKKKTAAQISNSAIDGIFERALESGARAGKISGAGGGGFIFFLVDPDKKFDVMREVAKEDGRVTSFSFTKQGTEGWRLK